MTLVTALNDWRYPLSVLLPSAVLARALFRLTPPPPGADKFRRAAFGAAFLTIKALRDHATEAAVVSQVISAEAAARWNTALRRQQRIFIVVSLLVTATASLFVFSATPVDAVPSWIYVVCGAAGALWLWRLWHP